MKITINPPDINNSEAAFTIQDNHTIQYGLAAIKNVGYKIAEQIAEYRNKNGFYKNIFVSNIILLFLKSIVLHLDGL